MYFAFLDYVNNEPEHRFPVDQRQMIFGQYLIPSKFDHLVDSVIDQLSSVFRADLPDLVTWRPYIARWRIKFLDGFENIPISLQQSLSYAHKDFYPNNKRIFVILLTLPVTSVCSERSFSSFRRLKIWGRATMDEKRLCGLAMLHILRDFNVSRENILRRFDEAGHKKIGTLQFEWQFISSNHTYYMYRTLSYYSGEFFSTCFFHWTHNQYTISFFLKPWIPCVSWMDY